MLVQPSTAKKIILACTTLHNFIRVKESSTLPETNATADVNNQIESDEVMQDVMGLAPLPVGGYGRLIRDAKELRDTLANYFLGIGSVAWQDAMVSVN